MRRRLMQLTAILGLLLGTALPAQAIVNGQPDNGAHPMVGELVFHLPGLTDPRFTDPGAWGRCTGTLVDPDTVVTAGHCTYRVGSSGKDVWFSIDERSDLSVLPPAAEYAPDDNAGRYATAVERLTASDDWHRATAIPHPSYVDLMANHNWADIPFHDVGVLQLDDRLSVPAYGRLPRRGLLDALARANPRKPYTVVGFGSTTPAAQTDLAGGTRRLASTVLVDLDTTVGLVDGQVATFSGSGTPDAGSVCAGDSGGPILHARVITAVVSFNHDLRCSGATGAYRIDQPDDLAFLAPYVD